MVRAVLYKDFQAFVDEKGLERPCPECGTNGWQMVGDSDNIDRPKEVPMFLASLPELSEEGPATRAVSSYVMYCSHCGVIKLVAASVVWDWLEARGG